MADWFFFGCVYLDANRNGQVDPDVDDKIPGAVFSVSLKGGAGIGDTTSTDRCATAAVPGGLGPEDWPVTATVVLPDGLDYEPVGPTEVVLDYPESHVDFLFNEPDGDS
jgi:hypothetical protein